jgi:hypothetical protein
MPGKYSEYYTAPWNDIATVSMRWTSSSDKQMVLDTYGLGEPVVQDDVEYMTADYLINNIDLAFKVWREQPWGKHVPFDTFCEEILPYRVNTEPLENWRAKALASFADLNHSFQEQPDITAVEACTRLNPLLPWLRWDPDFPPMNFSMLMSSSRGTCDDMSALVAFAMRALGIPVTVDYTRHWSNIDVGHSWNAVSDSAGRHIPFIGCDCPPIEYQATLTNQVYRQMFAKQHDSIANIPDWDHSYYRNVSSEYDEFTDIALSVRFSPENAAEPVYLAALAGHRRWNIAGRGQQTNSGMIKFTVNSVKSRLYMPVFYRNQSVVPAHYPFTVSETGGIRFYEPDTTHSESVSVSDIAPTKEQNSICTGHVYELFFYNGREWESLGKQKVSDFPLPCRAPANALLYLQDVTTGEDGRVFIVEKGRQKWM